MRLSLITLAPLTATGTNNTDINVVMEQAFTKICAHLMNALPELESVCMDCGETMFYMAARRINEATEDENDDMSRYELADFTTVAEEMEGLWS